MTLDPWAEVAYVQTLQLRWSKCNQNKPWAEVANVRTFKLRWSKCQSNIRLACFRSLTLAKNTINIKGMMIYVCEAIAFQHSIAAQNVNWACSTNRLKREPWHGKIGWLHKTRFHFLVWCSDGGWVGVKPKRHMTYFAVKIDMRVAPKMRKNVDCLFMIKSTSEVIHFILIILKLLAMECYSSNKLYKRLSHNRSLPFPWTISWRLVVL